MSIPEPEDDDYDEWLDDMGLLCEAGGTHDIQNEVVWDSDAKRERRITVCSKCRELQ